MIYVVTESKRLNVPIYINNSPSSSTIGIADSFEDSKINKMIEELFSLYGVDRVIASKSLPKPSSQELTSVWERRVLEMERNKINDSLFIIFDMRISDKVGLFTMIGIAISEGKDFIIINDNLNLYQELPELTKSVFTSTSNALNGVISNDMDIIRKVSIDLNDRSLLDLVALGYSYDRDLNIEVISNKKNLILNKMTKNFRVVI